LAVVDLDDVRHITRVDVYSFTRQLRYGGCSTIVGIEKIPDVWIDGPVVDVDTEVFLESQVF